MKSYGCRLAMLCTLLACTVAAGCGDGRPDLVPVSGTVLVDGQPLARGFIRVFPQGSRPASAAIDENGQFELMTYESGDGCVLGAHPVAIIAFDEPTETTRRWYAPKKYSEPETSELIANIDGPTDSLQVDITWGGRPGPYNEKIE